MLPLGEDSAGVMLVGNLGRKQLWSGCAAIMVVLLFSACSSSSSSEPSDEPSPSSSGGEAFYVSLGDSLAAGYQPGQGRTEEGYVDDLWQSAITTIPDLQMKKFGCPGETSQSMVTGVNSPCKYAEDSQLDAAVAFLESHEGAVSFITIDIGANDVANSCINLDVGKFDEQCVVDAASRVGDQIAEAIAALRTAAGSKVPILGMTYHNPFLGTWGLVPGGDEFAKSLEPVWEEFNAGLTDAYEGAGAVVADVAATFRVDEFTPTVAVAGRGRLPVNVALTCQWTWFCQKKSLGDPHPNETGYRKIAETFDKELQPLIS